MAFDGAYLWVCNADGTVSRVRVNDETATTIAIGVSCSYPAYDGANLWFTSGASDVVVKPSGYPTTRRAHCRSFEQNALARCRRERAWARTAKVGTYLPF